VTTIEEIRDYYRDKNKNPVTMAKMFRQGWDELGTQGALSCKTQIAAASISNYVKVLKLSPEIQQHLASGKMKFRTARALGRVSARAEELAQPFLDGRLKSHLSDELVTIALKHPALSNNELVRIMKSPERRYIPPASRTDAQEPVKPHVPNLRANSVLKVAGLVALMKPEFEMDRLAAASALKILRKQVEAKLEELEAKKVAV